jgi:hypothetical protein
MSNAALAPGELPPEDYVKRSCDWPNGHDEGRNNPPNQCMKWKCADGLCESTIKYFCCREHYEAHLDGSGMHNPKDPDAEIAG